MESHVRAEHMIVSQQVILPERFNGLSIVPDGDRIAADLGLGEHGSDAHRHSPHGVVGCQIETHALHY
jgi:hypothetical protein